MWLINKKLIASISIQGNVHYHKTAHFEFFYSVLSFILLMKELVSHGTLYLLL